MELLTRHRSYRINQAIASVLAVGVVCLSYVADARYLDVSPQAEAIKTAKKNLCKSTDEYIKALKFLRESKEFTFQEQVARKIAFHVSRGCDGAAERFAQILVFIKTVGFSEKKALEMALEFAMSTPDVQKNFLEIFSKSFLKEFFDYEFSKALKVAFELSTDYTGDPAKVRDDYIELAKFCKEGTKLGLPMHFCADYSMRVARLSKHFDTGVAKPFLEVFKQLRERKDLVLDVKMALELSYTILKAGPTASENFFKAFEFATSDLKLDKKKALQFAADLSDHSYIGEEPPVLQPGPEFIVQ